MSNKKQLTLQLLLAFASIYIIWGSTFLAISYGLRGFPPFLLSALRFLLAGLLLLFWRLKSGERPNRLRSWKRNAITGLLILGGGTGLLAWGEQYVQSTEAAIAIATGPFWFIVIDKANWSHYFGNKLILTGLLTGFAGLLLFLGGSLNNSHADPAMRLLAFAVLALSSVFWVLGSLYSRKKPAGHSTFLNIAEQLIVAGLGMLLISLLNNELTAFRFAAVPASAWGGLAFLIFLGSIAAYLSYIWLLSVKDPVLVSTHTYINPVVAVLAGWLLVGEQISARQLLGLSVILAGVLLTNSARYRPGRKWRVKLRRARLFLLRTRYAYPLKTQL